MYDREKITPEFYDKLSESEKKELVQIILEDQMTNCIKRGGGKFVMSTKYGGLPTYEELEDIMRSQEEWDRGFMSTEWNHPITQAEFQKNWDKCVVDEDITVTGATQNFKPNQEFDRLQKIVDKPYPVMMPEDVKTMREMSDEFMGKLLRDLRENSPCRMIPISTISEISPPDQDEMIKSVKRLPIHTYDWAIAPSHRADRMGRIWLDSMPKLCEHVGISKEEYLTWLYDSARKHGYQPNTLYIRPRAFGRIYKSALWMKLLGMEAQSYSIDEFPMLPEPITTVQLYDVIHWNHAHINYTFGLKAKDCRARYALEELIGYNDLSPISRMIVDSLKVNGPEMLKRGKLVGPNFNEDKNALERVIKRRKKK